MSRAWWSFWFSPYRYGKACAYSELYGTRLNRYQRLYVTWYRFCLWEREISKIINL